LRASNNIPVLVPQNRTIQELYGYQQVSGSREQSWGCHNYLKMQACKPFPFALSHGEREQGAHEIECEQGESFHIILFRPQSSGEEHISTKTIDASNHVDSPPW